jgi:hypothetical protein
MTLEECRKNVGEFVIYQPYIGFPHPSSDSFPPYEVGRIRRVNEYYAFVMYYKDSYGKATNPADLTLLKEAMP